MFLALVAGASAEHLIYKSVGRQTVHGGGKSVPVTSRGFQILDALTLKGTAIGSFVLNGQKFYTVVPMDKYRVDLVAGARGAIYTVISKAESPGTQFQGVLLEAASMRGKNQFLKISPMATAFAPKILISVSRSINSGNGNTFASEGSGSSILDIRATFGSNQIETFDQAVTRHELYFASRGYSKITLSPP